MSKTIALLEGQSSKLVFKPTFRNEPIPNGVSIDLEKSVLQDAIELGDVKENEDGITGEVPFTVKGKKEAELKVVFVRDGGTGEVEGKDISTKTINLAVAAADLSIETDSTVKIKELRDNSYTIPVSITNGDQSIPLKDPLLLNGSAEYFDITVPDKDHITVKLKEDKVNKDPTVWSTPFNVILNFYSGKVERPFTIYWKPVITTDLLISEVAFGDKGSSLIEIYNGKKEAITDRVTNLVCNDEYINVAEDGTWEVIKRVTEDTVRELTFTFDYQQLGFVWNLSVSVPVKFLARPNSVNVTLLSGASVSPLESGSIKVGLVYDTGEIVTDAVYVTHTNTSPSNSFSSFGRLSTSNAAKGEYNIAYTTGYVAGYSGGTTTIKTKYGNYTIKLPRVQTYDTTLNVVPNTTLLNKGATNDKYTLTANQRQSIDGPAVNLTGTLEVIWIRGARVVSGPTGTGPWTMALADADGGNLAQINFKLGNLGGSLSLSKA